MCNSKLILKMLNGFKDGWDKRELPHCGNQNRMEFYEPQRKPKLGEYHLETFIVLVNMNAKTFQQIHIEMYAAEFGINITVIYNHLSLQSSP